jgi:hypothetical protein
MCPHGALRAACHVFCTPRRPSKLIDFFKRDRGTGLMPPGNSYKRSAHPVAHPIRAPLMGGANMFGERDNMMGGVRRM